MNENKVEPAPEKTEKQKEQEAMLEKLNAASARLEAENKRMERNRAMAEAERVEKMLDGQGEAGIETKKKEISPEEYVRKIMAGELP